jgi:hypothetical protein
MRHYYNSLKSGCGVLYNLMLLVRQLGNSTHSDWLPISHDFDVRAPESLKNIKRIVIGQGPCITQNVWHKTNDWSLQTMIRDLPKSPFHHLQATMRQRNVSNNYKYKNMENEFWRPSFGLWLAGKGEGLSRWPLPSNNSKGLVSPSNKSEI